MCYIYDKLQRESVYDYCISIEDDDDAMPHIHIAVRYATEIPNIFTSDGGIFRGWNLQLVPEPRWDLALEYTKKGGVYNHLRERLPRMYADPSPTWRPWQQAVLDVVDDPRKIVCVVDEKGGSGKTFLAMWHAVRYRAVILPLLRSYQDMMRCIYAQPAKMYFIDIPRALSKKQQKEVYAAAESIKNGYAYDDRYQFKRRYFDPPKVVIYTNQMPDMEQLSIDRWIFIYPQHYLLLRQSALGGDTPIEEKETLVSTPDL